MLSVIPADIEIAQSCQMKPITAIAATLGLGPDDIESYGHYKAKLPLRLIDPAMIRKHHLVLVTAITPTPSGEGKTTTCIGLADPLNRIGRKTIAVLREPSLGPVFGMKGGAAGGGYSQVVPMEDINLHFTGDFSAIEKANNLLSALIDNNLQSKTNNLQIDPRTIVWKRVMDMNDRSLRHIIVGLGGSSHGIPREDGFNITAASEIMAILCLAEGIDDLKRRLGNIYIGMNSKGEPVFARDLNAVGALAALLKDAMQPNLVQTLENNPAIMHGGPFASIAQGTNSVSATKMGLSLADYVVTEAGFGTDLGAEKFFDIKCMSAGLTPEAAVLVVTLRALRHHGGARKEELKLPNAGALQKGLPNLEKHIENLLTFGMKPVVAINSFADDSPAEIHLIDDCCKKYGVRAIVCNNFSDGGEGAIELANEVTRIVAGGESHFTPLYEPAHSIEEKIFRVATKMYGARNVEYAVKAKSQLRHIRELGFEQMPVCMAKTPKSLSDDESRRGRPSDFIVTVREFEFASGAGFVIPILGDMMRMPGLPLHPAAEQIDIDNTGRISGLF